MCAFRAHLVLVSAVATLLLAACQAADNAGVEPEPDREVQTPATPDEPEEDPPVETAPDDAVPDDDPAGPVEVTTSVIANGLEVPWGIAFLPDGRALIAERDSGRLVTVDPDSGSVEMVQQLPIDPAGEGGFLGVALSPTYEDDELVYTYRTTPQGNVVERFRLGEDPEPILEGIPAGQIHNGGRIAFGPDDLLYVTTGDAADAQLAQDPDSLAGKILRIQPDGDPAADNPLDNAVYSMGHRNVQGLAWAPDGQLYASEFGADQADEVNRIEPGGNYGWPEVEGFGGNEEFIDPIEVYPPSEASPSGAAILQDGAIPQWEGNFFMAALRGQRLWRLELAADGRVASQESLLVEEFGRLRSVTQAPDGSLWVLTSNRDGRGDPAADDDRVIRLGPPVS
jgi:glucose/arabinose dehydrogenase